MPELDYMNRPVRADEGPEEVICVWELTDLTDEFDFVLVRGWKDMLNAVRGQFEGATDGVSDADLMAGYTLTVKLREMTRREYEEIVGD